MHRPFMCNSGNGKGWDSCRNPVNAIRTTRLQDKFLSRDLTSGGHPGEWTGLLGCQATRFGEEGTDCQRWPCSYRLCKGRLISNGCPRRSFCTPWGTHRTRGWTVPVSTVTINPPYPIQSLSQGFRRFQKEWDLIQTRQHCTTKRHAQADTALFLISGKGDLS